MNKIWLIARREYMIRVKKRSFLLVTFLTPLGMIGLIAAMIFIGQSSKEFKTIHVKDETGLFAGNFEDTDEMAFVYTDAPLEAAKEATLDSGYYGLLHIPELNLYDPQGVEFFRDGNASLGVMGELRSDLREMIRAEKLRLSGISETALDSLETSLSIPTRDLLDEEATESSAGLATAVGYICSFLIYLFTFLYGAMVMRGVIEEKSNRIVEVIVSTVKPFQLMMGKVLGVASVGLTQLVLWIVLLVVLGSVTGSLVGADAMQEMPTQGVNMDPEVMEQMQQEMGGTETMVNDLMGKLANMPWGKIVIAFIFYFVGGYLMYGALFAAVGAAVDSDADSQQFMFPITIPLILSIVSLSVILEDPDGGLATWMSMIPLTSPVVMMMRVPFGGVATWELLVSMVLLVLGFIGTIWLAGRIYRIGILMHGAKINYRVLAKWVRMKN